MNNPLLAVTNVAAIVGTAGEASAWQLGYKEGGVCVTMQSATSGAGQMEIAYLPQGAYLIKFNSSGSIGDKIEGVVSVQKDAKWTDYSVNLETVNDAVMGKAAYSYEGMSDQLRNAIRAGSTLKHNESEFALSGSGAALDDIVACVKSRT